MTKPYGFHDYPFLPSVALSCCTGGLFLECFRCLDKLGVPDCKNFACRFGCFRLWGSRAIAALCLRHGKLLGSLGLGGLL